jgi:hypothetical protein
MKKGAVHDAASAIQRACSQARQLARSTTEPRVTTGYPKWYGVCVVVPPDGDPNEKAPYAVVVYGNTNPSDYNFASNKDNQYPNGTPRLDGSATPYSGLKAAAKFKFSRNVMPVKSDSAAINPADYTFMGSNSAVGWYYQYRTGFVFNDVSKPTKGVDIGVPNSDSIKPMALGVSSLDRKYIVAVAIYKIGLLNVQDVN